MVTHGAITAEKIICDLTAKKRFQRYIELQDCPKDSYRPAFSRS
jgi:hypothetical protein